jgi:sugar lactone lactonase YvrE
MDELGQKNSFPGRRGMIPHPPKRQSDLAKEGNEMSRAFQTKLMCIIAVIAAIVVSAAAVQAQDNPYRVANGWAQLPAGMTWGAVISVDVDARGNIWVFHRNQPYIIEFDPSGKLVKSFGTGMFVQAHGMTIDRDGNIWVTDAQSKDGKGQQVFKLSPDGKVLMTLGKPGVAAEGPDTFNGPTDVVVAPNGDIFVSDGHVANSNGRIVKFSKDGKFIKAWGKKGTGPGEMDTPHSIAIDSQGRLFVADRSNSRIQIFDRDGRFIDQWKQFGRPSGVFIDKNDTIYVADSQSNAMLNPGFKRGLRIGSAKDGKVTALIPFVESEPDKNNNAGMEGVTADAAGNVYIAETTTQSLKKYIKGGRSQ